MQKSPFYSFRKSLYRIDVVHKISQDLQENECEQFEYKNLLLNQAYLVYMVAAWQGYIENLATYYFAFITYDVNNPALTNVLQNKRNNAVRRFNTPNAEGLNTLFKELFGIVCISDQLEVEGLNNKDTKKYLHNLLSCRHEIAHAASCKSENLSNTLLISYRSFFLKLAVNLENIVHKELKESINGWVVGRH